MFNCWDSTSRHFAKTSIYMTCRKSTLFAYKQASETPTFLSSCHLIIITLSVLSITAYSCCCSNSFKRRTASEHSPVLNTSISWSLFLHSSMSEVCAFHQSCRDKWQSFSFPPSPWEAPQWSVPNDTTTFPGPWSHPKLLLSKSPSRESKKMAQAQFPMCHICTIWSPVSQDGVSMFLCFLHCLELLHHAISLQEIRLLDLRQNDWYFQTSQVKYQFFMPDIVLMTR